MQEETSSPPRPYPPFSIPLVSGFFVPLAIMHLLHTHTHTDTHLSVHKSKETKNHSRWFDCVVHVLYF